MKLGVEKTEMIVDALGELVKTGKLIAADKKVDLADLPLVLALIPKIPGLVDAFRDLDVVFAEAKDIDVAEVVALIQKISAKIKEIESL